MKSFIVNLLNVNLFYEKNVSMNNVQGTTIVKANRASKLIITQECLVEFVPSSGAVIIKTLNADGVEVSETFTSLMQKESKMFDILALVYDKDELHSELFDVLESSL